MLNNKNDVNFQYTIEHINLNDRKLLIEGWAFHPSKEIVRACIAVTDLSVIDLKHNFLRTDVAGRLGSKKALKSGFRGYGLLPAESEPAHLVFSFDDASQERIPLVLKRTRQPKTGRFSGFLKKGAILISKVPLLLTRENRDTVKILLLQLMRGEFKNLFSFAKQVVTEHENVWAAHVARKTQMELYSKLPNLAEALSCLAPKPLEVTPLPEPVDVIVPIYNGMEFLPRLLDTLFTHTALHHRFTFIDDASPDHRVWTFLNDYIGDRPNVRLIQNEQNLGFVKTANMAVDRVENHFVLLNSDVEVPPLWLERLMKPIYDHPDQVASTTPFSNAATICSFPEMNQDNKLFADLSVEELDAHFQYLQPGREVELPTGVGFCMGFNHNVVKRIGMFDAETFGAGFGEENDWSQRASKLGYRNLLVPNLFVYHKHGGSFLESKKPLLEKNLQKIKSLHPDYFGWVRDFCLEDPPDLYRTCMIMKIAACAASTPPLLIIDHDLGGGANRYRSRAIEKALRQDRAVFLLLSVPGLETMHLMVSYRQYRTNLVVNNPQDLEKLGNVIPIGEIFYNNLVGYADPLATLRAVVGLKSRTGASLTVSFHDFFPICPAYNLLDKNHTYCHPAKIEYCRECLPRNDLAAPVPVPDPVMWRESWADALTKSDTILVFSESSRDIVSTTYPSVADKIIVQPHKPVTIISKEPKIEINNRINIGVVGGINIPKGRNIVAGLVKTIAETRDSRVSVTVIGTLSPPLRESVLTVTGPYESKELPDLIEAYGVNIFLIPSIWPETFSYVAQELMDMSVPLCCFNLGAPAERVSRYARGRVLTSMNPAVILREIKQFFEQLRIGNELCSEESYTKML